MALQVSSLPGMPISPALLSTLDGTVMLATQMTSGQKTFRMRLATPLSLHHPFEDSNNDTDCPSNINCTSTGRPGLRH